LIVDTKKHRVLGKMNFYVHQTVDVYSINEATDTKMSKTVKVG